MDLGSPVPYLLFLHVMGAIVAFGPTYAFSIMGRMAGREPQHANFSTRQAETISRIQVIPLAIFQGVTGVLLILATGIRPEKQPWLVAGIILYLIALTYSLTIQRSAVARLVALTSTPPGAGGPPAGGPPGASPGGGPPLTGVPAGTPAGGVPAGTPAGGVPAGTPAGGPPAGTPAGGPPAASRSGPPPEIAATVRKIQRGGIFTGVLILVIVFLMVAKPGVGG